MSEFFLELFSEEIPASLQKNLRQKLLKDFQNFFEKKLIKSKKSFSLSSPNRLVIVFTEIDKQVKIKSEEIQTNYKPERVNKRNPVSDKQSILSRIFQGRTDRY